MTTIYIFTNVTILKKHIFYQYVQSVLPLWPFCSNWPLWRFTNKSLLDFYQNVPSPVRISRLLCCSRCVIAEQNSAQNCSADETERKRFWISESGDKKVGIQCTYKRKQSKRTIALKSSASISLFCRKKTDRIPFLFLVVSFATLLRHATVGGASERYFFPPSSSRFPHLGGELKRGKKKKIAYIYFLLPFFWGETEKNAALMQRGGAGSGNGKKKGNNSELFFFMANLTKGRVVECLFLRFSCRKCVPQTNPLPTGKFKYFPISGKSGESTLTKKSPPIRATPVWVQRWTRPPFPPSPLLRRCGGILKLETPPPSFSYLSSYRGSFLHTPPSRTSNR